MDGQPGDRFVQNSDDQYEEHPPIEEPINREEWMVVAGKGPSESVGVVEPGHREMDIQYNWALAQDQYGDGQMLKNFLKDQKDRNDLEIQEDEAVHLNLTISQQKVTMHTKNL
jgi:hypothetical protein